MARVVGVLVGRSGWSPVARQLTPLGDVEFESDPDATLRRAAAGGIGVVVTELHDARGRSIAPFVVGLTARAPDVPLVIFDRADAARMEALRTVLAPGIGAEFVVRPFEPLGPAVRRALDAPLPPGVAPLLLHHVVPRAPPALRVFLSLAALKAPTQRGIDELAHWSRISPRAVERRLARAGWATARTMLQSFRALDVAWLMTQYRWSAHRVQQVRGYPHASAITRLTQRYAGVGPAALRESGDFDAVLDAVVGSLMPGEERP